MERRPGAIMNFVKEWMGSGHAILAFARSDLTHLDTFELTRYLGS